MTEPAGVFIYVEVGDALANNRAARLLEEGQWHNLGKGWRARSDAPHVTGMKPHVHVYFKNSEQYVINRDGTPSHGSDLSTLPAKTRNALKTRSLIESMVAEALAADGFLVPPDIIADAGNAWDHQRLMHLALGHLRG